MIYKLTCFLYKASNSFPTIGGIVTTTSQVKHLLFLPTLEAVSVAFILGIIGGIGGLFVRIIYKRWFDKMQVTKGEPPCE